MLPNWVQDWFSLYLNADQILKSPLTVKRVSNPSVVECFTMSNSRVKKLSPEALEAGGTLRSSLAGTPSIPIEITVMIRTPYGMDRS